MKNQLIMPGHEISREEKIRIADFLHTHLDAFGDDHASIMNCIDFATNDREKFGGFIILTEDRGQIAGAVVVNKTGMEGYIPENILVYIAVHRDYRGLGLGKALMQETIDTARGSIKLHVEPENPARYLYEKLGFTSKYLEMRLQR